MVATRATFWEALDRLVRDSRREIVPRTASGDRGLDLVSIPGIPRPATVHGAFRCSVTGIGWARRVIFGDPTAEVSDRAIRRPDRPAGDPLTPVWAESGVGMLLLAEPRRFIDVELAGPPRVDEAVDDRGRSLVAPMPKFDRPTLYLVDSRFFFGMNLRVPLDLPRPPGRSIRRLRGVVPVITWVEHPEPLEVDLGEPAGRSIRGSDVVLKVVPRRPTSPPNAVVVEMVPEKPTRPSKSGLALFEAGPDRMFLDHDFQFEVLDGAGKRIEVVVSTDRVGAPSTWQVTLTPKPGSDRAIPARLRFRGLSWSETEVPFDFAELPLP